MWGPVICMFYLIKCSSPRSKEQTIAPAASKAAAPFPHEAKAAVVNPPPGGVKAYAKTVRGRTIAPRPSVLRSRLNLRRVLPLLTCWKIVTSDGREAQAGPSGVTKMCERVNGEKLSFLLRDVRATAVSVTAPRAAMMDGRQGHGPKDFVDLAAAPRAYASSASALFGVRRQEFVGIGPTDGRRRDGGPPRRHCLRRKWTRLVRRRWLIWRFDPHRATPGPYGSIMSGCGSAGG